MRIRFWGTRGSIAKPGPATVRYGGNTSCIEVRSPGNTLIVIDCGTGAHALGSMLAENSEEPVHGHMLISHTHWDHIQGIPFFKPFFLAANEWHIYGPRGLGSSLRETLAGQMQYTYFPVSLEQLNAEIHYHDLVEGRFEIEDVLVTTQYLNHPALTLGYRLEANGVCVVYASDHEPHSQRCAEQGYQSASSEDKRHAEFIARADLLIHDTQYTAEEYPQKKGWGHSTLEYVVDTALATGVRKLALFHHDPLREDGAIDLLVQRARERVARAGGTLEVFAATEGSTVQIEAVDADGPEVTMNSVQDLSTVRPALLAHSVLIAVHDPGLAKVLSSAVQADQITLHTATDGETALQTVSTSRPSLILLEHSPAGTDALRLCRTIRAREGMYGNDVPIVIVVNTEDEIDPRAGNDAGVTDWLVKPFSATYARTRMRAWLLRLACRWERAPMPVDEKARLRALQSLCILDTAAEERFDRYTRIASALFDVPIAAVSLVDAHRQWFKSCHGLTVTETPREVAFCAHAILQDSVFLVNDTLRDHRFADNPLVTGDPHVRFYAGIPLSVAEGSRVGTLCLIDYRPRELDATKLELLHDLGKMLERELAGSSADRTNGVRLD